VEKETRFAELKMDPKRPQGSCLFSRYDCLDKDLDVTRKSFIPHGAICPLLIAHQWSEVPVGKGKIRSERHGAYFDFVLADTPRGQELAAWLRFDFSDGASEAKSEWSYGFSILPGGSSRGMHDGQAVRFLHGRDDGSAGCIVHEISYTLKGAGVETALVEMREALESRMARLERKLQASMAERQATEHAQVKVLMARIREKMRR
jgi:hypothetical protein